MTNISNSLYTNNTNLYANLFSQNKNQATTPLSDSISDKEALQAIVDYVSPIEKRGVVVDSANYFKFEDTLIQKSKEINPPTKSQMQDAKNFLKNTMDNIITTIYRDNKETIEDSIAIEKAIELGENREYPKGGYELLNLLKSYPYVPQNSLDNGGKDLLEQVKRYVDTELSAVGTTFFNIAQDYIPKEQLAEIQDKLAIVHSYYLNGDSIEIDNKKFSYNAIRNDFNEFFVNEITNIENLVASNADYFLMQASYTASQSFFDILEKRDKLEKENQELKAKQAYSAYGISNTTNSIQTDSTSDSLMQALLKDSKENKNPRF
ncbi:hypothetical protein LS70_009795 [Helicobacter sp. MIT 11-5569]|uniref:hypothetical protein n=1 Tax=Helicobacter sp. MIT 11-5569 TaxID=1548151 RepID=UPI00051FCAB6|nr:hypothetical protein [Helicobacter sp. MIT 11-5569]TLD79675.1 hypothetical protein LS70_009795 [Helicobacter sp. MIT 11-5569]